jgi:hypothetical protein
MKKIKLTEEAYVCGGEYRIPTTEGKASMMVLNIWYQASAEDTDGNEYTVIWTIKNPNTEDESDACNWYDPYAILDEHGCEVSESVELAD